MSFKKQHNSVMSVDYKGRLEHKLYLARENPAPIFDISDCALKNVPSGIYSLCKVFRKKELNMSKNKLSSLSGGGELCDLSLLTLLDLGNNEFTQLPIEISYLTSLEELYLQNNYLKKLPDELTTLFHLKILNIASNKLKYLPESIGNLKNLSILNISKNESLKKLPQSLGQADKLEEIKLEGLNHMTYPPEYIIEGGTIAIVAFLAREWGIIDSRERDAYLDAQIRHEPETTEIVVSKQLIDEHIVENNFQEQRSNALLEVEKNIRKQQEYEVKLQSINRGYKTKLLKDVALEQSRLELKIEQIQHEKELNRSRLLDFIYNAEKEANSVIQEFLKSSETERHAQTKLLEDEKKERLELLSKSHVDQSLCRTKETLLAMEKLLEEELSTERKIAEYTKFRDYTAQSMLSLQLQSNDHLASVIRDQSRDKQNLIDLLKTDRILQKAALAALLERSDARCWSIVQRVNLIESQLVTLTSIELERKKLEINQQINDIAEKRIILSEILMNLLEQQEKRRQQLLETINQMEEHHENDNNTRRNSLFWLMQYQSLMDSRPQGLLEGLEPMLVRHVTIAGALHCLPFLASLSTLLPNEVDDNQLELLGIQSKDDRRAILMAIENYLAEKKMCDNECSSSTAAVHVSSPIEPSAPIEEPCSSSTNTLDKNNSRINTAECAICLDSQSQIIFLPCGHCCCCVSCSIMITTECPMCRGCIQRKIQIYNA